jgi:CRP/FNR family transcriptional activator FtrB
MRRIDCDHIRALPLFRGVTQAIFVELLRDGFLRQFPAHITLLNEGDSPDFLHIVMNGSVELFCNYAGRETTTDIIYPKATFGLAAIIRDSVHLNSVRTLAPSTVLMIPSAAIRSVLRNDMAFAHAIGNELAANYLRTFRALKNQKLRSGTERLTNWILDADRRQGSRGRIVLSYDKRILAAFLGMTPESLSRKLASLVPHGVVGSGRELVITDRAALRRLAKPNPLLDG